MSLISNSAKSAAIMATALTLPIALAAGLIAANIIQGRHPAGTAIVKSIAPVSVIPITSLPAGSKRWCEQVHHILPRQVGSLTIRKTTPENPATAAWGDPPVRMRCGVGKPAAYTRDAQLWGINGVDWVIAETDSESVWTTVSLPVYIELTIPKRYTGVGADIISPFSTAVHNGLTAE